MKKQIKIFLCLLLAVCFCACSKTESVEVSPGVEFSLKDVVKVTNSQMNTVYYYFLASIDNHSDATYHMSNLDYNITDKANETAEPINLIDTYKTIITNDVRPDQSTFVYGYIGFPDGNHSDPGLYFPAEKTFLPFSSIHVRDIDDDNVVHSDEAAFTIYDDSDFSFAVDASDLKYDYSQGVSTVSGLKITYTNKTSDRLVVPFLTPICTMSGISINNRSNTDELKKMNLEEIKKQDFKENGLAPKTKTYTGQALGYQLYYLSADQEVTCDISFTFEDVIPDFGTTNGIVININSPALGYSQLMQVKY